MLKRLFKNLLWTFLCLVHSHPAYCEAKTSDNKKTKNAELRSKLKVAGTTALITGLVAYYLHCQSSAKKSFTECECLRIQRDLENILREKKFPEKFIASAQHSNHYGRFEIPLLQTQIHYYLSGEDGSLFQEEADQHCHYGFEITKVSNPPAYCATLHLEHLETIPETIDTFLVTNGVKLTEAGKLTKDAQSNIWIYTDIIEGKSQSDLQILGSIFPVPSGICAPGGVPIFKLEFKKAK